MRFKQIVEELYERYARVVEKEEKIEKVREKARELGFENVEVKFNEKTTEARAVIVLNEDVIGEGSYRKLRETAEWLMGESYTVYSLKLLITTKEKEDQDLHDYIHDKAQQVGIKHVTYVQLNNGVYVEYFEIEKDEEQQIYVYLLVYNEYSE